MDRNLLQKEVFLYLIKNMGCENCSKLPELIKWIQGGLKYQNATTLVGCPWEWTDFLVYFEKNKKGLIKKSTFQMARL